MLLVGVNVVFVLAALVLNVLLAIYIVTALHAAAWIAGALLTLNTALVGTLQTVVARWSESRRATRAITMAALLNALAFGSFALLDAAPCWLGLPGLVMSLVVYTAAELVGSPAMSTLSVSLPPAALRGRYQAVFQTSWTIGGALASRAVGLGADLALGAAGGAQPCRDAAGHRAGAADADQAVIPSSD